MTPLIPAHWSAQPVEACRQLMIEAMQSYRVPARYGKAAAALKLTDTLLFIESSCDDVFQQGKLLLLLGDPDGGKSFAAYALGCYGYLRHGVSFRGFQVQELMPMAWRDESRADYNDAWAHRGLLILDEMDKAGTTEGVSRALYAGLNQRYALRLPTVITANGTLAAALARYPEFAAALQSRFSEWATHRAFINPPKLRSGQAVELAAISVDPDDLIEIEGETFTRADLAEQGRRVRAEIAERNIAADLARKLTAASKQEQE